MSDASWQLLRVFIRVSSTLISRSNEKKSCIGVSQILLLVKRGKALVDACQNLNQLKDDESWQARVCVRVSSTLTARSSEKKSYTKVDWLLLEYMLLKMKLEVSHSFSNELLVE